MRSIWLGCALFFVGCATAGYVHLPDGSRGHMIACSGLEHDWGDCMNGAHEACGGNYRILERYAARGDHALASRRTRGPAGPESCDRKMLVACAP